MKVDLEEKIRTLVEEILTKILKNKLLIIFTGGKVGIKTALAQLEKTICTEKIVIDLLFSTAGSKVHDIDSIKTQLDANKVYVEGQDRIDNLRDYIGIVFATLTRNTASRIANLILDTYSVEIVIDALMLGIPIVASRDAADIESHGWKDLGFHRANVNLKAAFRNNLNIMQDYGVHLCSADNLHRIIRDEFFGIKNVHNAENKSLFANQIPKINKNPITRKDIIPFIEKNHEIYIPSDALITPLAQDIIKDFSIKIIRE